MAMFHLPLIQDEHLSACGERIVHLLHVISRTVTKARITDCLDITLDVKM